MVNIESLNPLIASGWERARVLVVGDGCYKRDFLRALGSGIFNDAPIQALLHHDACSRRLTGLAGSVPVAALRTDQ